MMAFSESTPLVALCRNKLNRIKMKIADINQSFEQDIKSEEDSIEMMEIVLNQISTMRDVMIRLAINERINNQKEELNPLIQTKKEKYSIMVKIPGEEENATGKEEFSRQDRPPTGKNYGRLHSHQDLGGLSKVSIKKREGGGIIKKESREEYGEAYEPSPIARKAQELSARLSSTGSKRHANSNQLSIKVGDHKKKDNTFLKPPANLKTPKKQLTSHEKLSYSKRHSGMKIMEKPPKMNLEILQIENSLLSSSGNFKNTYKEDTTELTINNNKQTRNQKGGHGKGVHMVSNTNFNDAFKEFRDKGYETIGSHLLPKLEQSSQFAVESTLEKPLDPNYLEVRSEMKSDNEESEVWKEMGNSTVSMN